ncbi:hypothetical protein BP5796_01137 [Coleophoma crateriformis]|uniref:Serine hydrolase domain-containing protein n=1 Tax=Coleophoma crateriformis TaxID=565419 RepID=A0A3D8TA37_9HELO|nr:hypothetical protein BP5796_01137 [Coleophoma crateriformis]
MDRTKTASVGPKKPAILCLHGGGTSAMIFNFQTMRLRRELDSTFDFVFIDAPFESKPGPNVLPVFEDCGPFYVWVDVGQNQGVTPPETRDLLNRTMENQIKTTGMPFVGVLGFSQGTKIAAGLLQQQEWDVAAEKDQGVTNGARQATDFKFGVFLMGAPPPLAPRLPVSQMTQKISIPSVHVVGLQDAIIEWTRSLCADHFEQDSVSLLELNAGHHLPDGQHQMDTAKIAKAILDIWAHA